MKSRIPKPLLDAIRNGRDAHAGLWCDRLFHDDSSGDDKEATSRHIMHLSTIHLPQGYSEALQRHDQTMADFGATPVQIRFPGKLVTGLGAKNAMEFGLSLDPTWGAPMISGSSLKGATRAFCAELGGPWAEAGGYGEQLFGTPECAGVVSFYDAWWSPEGATTLPIRLDVLTPHHKLYYEAVLPDDSPGALEGEGAAHWPEIPAPDGMSDPVPIHFAVVVNATFRLWLSGPAHWIDAARQILLTALSERGIGAKTSSGYGRAPVTEDTGASGQ